MPLPDFLIAGVPKAGTTALHAALAPHPELFLSAVKEPKFFLSDGPPPTVGGPGDVQTYQEHVWRRDDYEALFAPAPAGVRLGEATPFYLYDTEAHVRVEALIPSARLVLLLRDPVDRAHSNWTHLWNAGLEPEADFLAACRAEPERRAAGWAPFWHVRPVKPQIADRSDILVRIIFVVPTPTCRGAALSTGISALPLPRWDGSTVVVEPPGDEPGAWAGAPSSIFADGAIYLAYRLRLPVGAGRGIANVVARSADGLAFSTVAEVGKDRFGAESLERPALVRTPEGRWRLYLSAATPGTKHWRVDLLEAGTPEGLATAPARTVLAGDETIGVKDPVLHHDEFGWHLWASVHPLESWTDADRMTTWYATGPDGVRWTWRGAVLAGRPGEWDARGVRVSSVRVDGDEITVAYDGRASAGENWEERTGVARGKRLADGTFGALAAEESEPVGSPHAPNGLRYLSVVTLPDGRQRLYYEATRADGAHHLRTEPALHTTHG